MKLEIPVVVDISEIESLIDEIKHLQTYKLSYGDEQILIDRDDVIKIFTAHVRANIKQEHKKGKWIFVNKFRGQHKCSVCGVVAVQARNGFHLESSPSDNTGEHAIVIDHYKELLSDYCPNCGAKMEIEE